MKVGLLFLFCLLVLIMIYCVFVGLVVYRWYLLFVELLLFFFIL